MANENLTLGALEIGAFLSIFLFGVVTTQGFVYYQQCKRDRPLLKFMVAFVWLCELGHAICAAHAVYIRAILLFIHPEDAVNTTSLSATIFFEILLTLLVQFFFAFRIRKLSGRSRISVICWVLSVLRFLGGIVLAVEGITDAAGDSITFRYQEQFGWLITASLTIGAVVDVIIAVSLCYFFNQRFATYKKTSELLDRLTMWTIQTGLLTSIVSVAVVICFQTMEENFVWISVYMVLAKLYSNSFLASVNFRFTIRQVATDGIGTIPMTRETRLEFAVQSPQRTPSTAIFPSESQILREATLKNRTLA